VVERGSSGLALTLRTTRGGMTDEHRMEAATCAALVDAAALVVAVTLDPMAVAESGEAELDDERGTQELVKERNVVQVARPEAVEHQVSDEVERHQTRQCQGAYREPAARWAEPHQERKEGIEIQFEGQRPG